MGIVVRWIPFAKENCLHAMALSWLQMNVVTSPYGVVCCFCLTCSPFYKHGLTLIPAWISNHTPGKVWWNYLSIPKLQRCNRWTLGMDKQFRHTHYNGCNYLSMLGLKLIHVSKRGYWSSDLTIDKSSLNFRLKYNIWLLCDRWLFTGWDQN